MDEELLNLTITSRVLGVSSTWLRAEADAGRVPALQAGKTYLFNLEAVKKALLKRASTVHEGEVQRAG